MPGTLTQASGDTLCHCAADVHQGWSSPVSTVCQDHFHSQQMVVLLPEIPDKEEIEDGERIRYCILLKHSVHTMAGLLS